MEVLIDPQLDTVYTLAKKLRTGAVKCEEVVQAYSSQILSCEGTEAWIYLDLDRARQRAEHLDSFEQPTGYLRGVPVGIKDVIDTASMPTAYGSDFYQKHIPEKDAECVTRLKHAGAIVVGKTVTTEFAYRKVPKTKNPWDSTRTPGGSSSGSAAAVAACMVPIALGTQTAGSVIRPASFCGVVGYKGSFGWCPLGGVKVFAPSLDTLGVFARTVADIKFCRLALTGVTNWSVSQRVESALEERMAVSTPPATSANPSRPWRVGLCRTPYWDAAEEPTRAVLAKAAQRLARHGAIVRDVTLPVPFGLLNAAQITVMEREGRESLSQEWAAHRASPILSAELEEFILAAERVTDASYANATQLIGECRACLRAVFADNSVDVLLCPSAPGEPPLLEANTTGDPVFNRMWTALGCPAINLPARRPTLSPTTPTCSLPSYPPSPSSPSRNRPDSDSRPAAWQVPPVGVQFVAPVGQDDLLLDFALWAERWVCK